MRASHAVKKASRRRTTMNTKKENSTPIEVFSSSRKGLRDAFPPIGPTSGRFSVTTRFQDGFGGQPKLRIQGAKYKVYYSLNLGRGKYLTHLGTILNAYEISRINFRVYLYANYRNSPINVISIEEYVPITEMTKRVTELQSLGLDVKNLYVSAYIQKDKWLPMNDKQKAAIENVREADKLLAQKKALREVAVKKISTQSDVELALKVLKDRGVKVTVEK